MNDIKIHFLGASETVTGSKYLIETGKQKILVDCGLFQGLKSLRELNWSYFPINIKDIDLVLLTHGHIDHSGYLPRLVKSGYKYEIIGTKPTLEIAEIVLQDSGKIQEEDAERANKEGFSKHAPAKPLYTLADAVKSISHFRAVEEDTWIDLFPNIRVKFRYNGHIIGSTYIELEVNSKKIVFSGDLGRLNDTLLYPPKKPDYADILFVESTYGNRNHSKDNGSDKLREIINHTVEKGGTLIIPSFAVERTQSLMYLIWQLKKNKEIPDIPLIMDSPMGANVLNVFKSNLEWHKLNQADCIEMFKAFRVVLEYKETWEVIDDKSPKIVIAGSGMLNGGRVLTYLQQYVKNPETSILLAGFQAEGTRGRRLLEGEKEMKIYGKYYPVKAEVFNIDTLSAHADQEEILDWLSEVKIKPKKVYIIHGERHQADGLRVKLKDTFGWDAKIPSLYSIEDIKFDD
jgi:metallo-beta-lactamase family protein